jgi:hypothetical protein
MSSSPLLVGQNVRAPTTGRREPEVAWGLLGSAGLAFTVIALVDQVLVLLPLRFGDRKWEFDTITAVLSGMPLLTMGLALGYASAFARDRTGALRGWSTFMVLIAAGLAAALALYLLRVPSILSGAEPGAVQVELGKAVIKTACQGVAYPVALCWLGIRGWAHTAEY